MSYRGRYAPTNYEGYGQNLLASRIYGQALPPWMDPGRQADTAGQGEDAMMQALLERLGMGGGGGGQGPMGPPQGPMGGGRSSIPGLEPEDPLDAMISRLQEEVMPSRALVGERGYDLPRFENPEYRGRKQEELDAVLEKKRKSDLAKRGFDPETEYRKGIIEGLNAGTRNAELLGTQIEHAKGQLARAMEEEANLRNPTNASFLSLPPKQQEQVRAEAAARTAAARNQVENAVQMQSGAIKNNAAMLGVIIRRPGEGMAGSGGQGLAAGESVPMGKELTEAEYQKTLRGEAIRTGTEPPAAAKRKTPEEILRERAADSTPEELKVTQEALNRAKTPQEKQAVADGLNAVQERRKQAATTQRAERFQRELVGLQMVQAEARDPGIWRGLLNPSVPAGPLTTRTPGSPNLFPSISEIIGYLGGIPWQGTAGLNRLYPADAEYEGSSPKLSSVPTQLPASRWDIRWEDLEFLPGGGVRLRRRTRR